MKAVKTEPREDFDEEALDGLKALEELQTQFRSSSSSLAARTISNSEMEGSEQSWPEVDDPCSAQ